MSAPAIQDITVRDAGGAYQTSTVRGQRASSTAGGREAAERLGQKLYGASLVAVEALPHGGADTNAARWRLHAEPVHAWCWQSGLIEFGCNVREGALKFATGMDAPLRDLVGALARHGKGKSEGELLVPGVPEAEGEEAKLDALIAWVAWCGKGNGTKKSGGVVFTNRQDGRRKV